MLSSALAEEGISWDATENRIRCIGHIINLAVKEFLFQGLVEEEQNQTDNQDIHNTTTFRNLGPLGKLHNIVVYIRSSPARTRQFTGLAGRGNPP